MSDFSVLVVSNASTDVHPENSTANFTNILPHSLSLRGNWQVALQTISFHNTLSNLPAATLINVDNHMLVVPGTSRQDTMLKIKFLKRFYTPASVRAFLKTVTPPVYSKYFDANINEQGRLAISLKGCSLFVQELFCFWLELSAVDRPRHNFNGVFYTEFDARTINLELISESDRYGEEVVPSFVKIQLREMKATLAGGGFHQDLAVIPYEQPQGAANQLFFYEAAKKEYFKISEDTLQCLSLKLCGDNNQQLVIPSRQPTFVKLNFKNMHSSGSFQVRLCSNDSLDLFPQNTSSNFRVQLPRELSLDGNNWEVALSSLHYPSEIDPISFLPPQHFWIKVLFNSDLAQWQPLTISFETVRNVSGESLARAIAEKVSAKFGPNVLRVSMTPGGRMQFEALNRQINIHLSPLFALVVGEIVVSPPATFYDLAVPKSSKLLLPGVVNVSICLPQNLLVYCDVISPVISGGKYCNVLKLIPVPLGKKNNNYTTYVSRHLDYADVATDRVQTLHFVTSAATGEEVTFSDKTALSYVTIIFRRKK